VLQYLNPRLKGRKVRVFKNKAFARFARKAGLDDSALCKAIGDAQRGLVDADLGGGVIKQRIARRGGGKSRGFRVLIVFRAGERAFFVYGFAKNELDNVGPNELAALRKLASELLAYDNRAVQQAINARALIEVFCDAQAVS
jgi:hypothetical protein